MRCKHYSNADCELFEVFRQISREEVSIETNTQSKMYPALLTLVLTHIAPLHAPLIMQHIVGASVQPQTAKIAHEWPMNGPLRVEPTNVLVGPRAIRLWVPSLARCHLGAS